MNICFVSDSDCFGGGEIWLLRASRVLEDLGCHHVVVCRRDSMLCAECGRIGVAHVGYAASDGAIGLQQAVARAIGERRIDMLYCTIAGRIREARALEELIDRANETRADKIAIVLKTGLPPMGRLTPRHYGCDAGPSIRRMHVVAPGIRQAFVDWRSEFGDGFVEVFREGVELDRFTQDPETAASFRDRWEIAPDAVVIACIGRLADGMKGQSVLLRAIPQLRLSHPGTVCVLAGDGDDRGLLEELAEDLDITSSVRFTGHVRDVVPLLCATDILCQPSIHDGLPNAIVEAMAMERPVVASRVGAIPDLIVDEASGLLVRPNDVGQLTAALQRMLRNAQNERTRFARGALERVRTDWDLRRNVAALASRLDDELREFRAAPTRPTAPARAPDAIPVLFVVNRLRLGGEETELAILARYLDSRRFRMSVLSLAASGEVAPAVEKITSWGIPVDRVCETVEGYSNKLEYLLTKIRRDAIRLVVGCHDTRLVYDAFAHLPPDECRLIEHGGIIEDVANAPKERTTRYIGVSQAIADAARPMMKGPDAAICIPSMVDTHEYDDETWAAARAWSRQWVIDTCLRPHGLADDTCIVVSVGRLDPRKRVEDFIRAADRIQRAGVRALFLIVGGRDAFHPDYLSRLEDQAAALIDAHALLFTGPRGDIAGLLSASDILVLTSAGEGMAHVINEAGAAGLAVVATNDGAVCEQLDHGRCGIIVDVGDVDRVADALTMLIGDSALRRALGARLRERVRAKYAARVVIERWHAVLDAAARELDHSNV